MSLEVNCKKFTTINTHQSNRLPYGISSTPGIFQRALENLLKGILSVVVRIDDIVITSKSDAEHVNTSTTEDSMASLKTK
ncbi:unnamed protein product [Caretta caretta]